ncbi:MAG: acyl carrier protein [Lachnospiraceae bacterium]|nr:acyl carrier protein [Lachnospiraceae bacterium]
MEELLEVLKESCPTVDFENETELVSGKVIDSMDLIAIISDIEEAFDISIDMDKIEPENFDSLEAIWELIQQIKGE